MTFLRFIKKTQQHIATAIVFSILLQTCAQAACLNETPHMLDRTSSQCCDEQDACIERTECVHEQCERGCPCHKPKPSKGCPCNKPKPSKGCPCHKPKPPRSCDVISDLAKTILDDAQKAGCGTLVSEAVRACYAQPKITKNVLSAMPTLMQYALEQVDRAEDNCELEKAKNSVEALVSYVEKHAEKLKNHPACSEIMNLLESTTENMTDKATMTEHMQSIVRKIQRSCCPDTCDSTPLTPTGDTIIVEPGNYCLTTDASVNITINSPDVSLDLNARALSGLITINANNCSVKNGYITPPAPLTDVDAATAAVTINGNFVSVCSLTIECADSVGRDSTLVSNFGTALAGRDGIQNNGSQNIIKDCVIYAGSGADGNGAGDLINTATPFDNGGNGGFGIRVVGQRTEIIECFIVSGNGGSASDVCTCVTPSPMQFNGGNGGIGIDLPLDALSNGCLTQISDNNIITGNGGNGGNTCCSSINGGNGGDAGRGISNSLSKTEIDNCIICTGNGGNGGGNITANNTQNGGNGGIGGDGIYTNGTQITNCSITTGNGGNGGTAGNGGFGGRGGRGIMIDTPACKTAIRTNFVEKTGVGGTGGFTVSGSISGTNGNGGDGGDAIWISSDAQTTEVRLNTLSNTGFGGPGGVGADAAPGTDGTDGLAVLDLNSTSSSHPICVNSASIVYSNFAYAIANSTRYILGPSNPNPNGVPVAASTSPYDNVFTP